MIIIMTIGFTSIAGVHEQTFFASLPKNDLISITAQIRNESHSEVGLHIPCINGRKEFGVAQILSGYGWLLALELIHPLTGLGLALLAVHRPSSPGYRSNQVGEPV